MDADQVPVGAVGEGRGDVTTDRCDLVRPSDDERREGDDEKGEERGKEPARATGPETTDAEPAVRDELGPQQRRDEEA